MSRAKPARRVGALPSPRTSRGTSVKLRRRRGELNESFAEWFAVNTEADGILGAKRLQEEDLRRSFRRDAAALDQTEKNGELT